MEHEAQFTTITVICPYCAQANRIRIRLQEYYQPMVISCDIDEVPGCDRWFVVQPHMTYTATVYGITDM